MAQIDRQTSFDLAKRRVQQAMDRHRWAKAVAAVTGILLVGSVVLGVFGASGHEFRIEREAGSAASSELEAAGERDDIEGSGVNGSDDADSPYEKTLEPASVVVDVGGAVKDPGVVELEVGSRVIDAIEAAGGLSEDADCETINQAEVLQDAQKVYVPHEGESQTAATSGATASHPSATSSLVNINTADVSELDALPGIGPATAQAIIDDREANGSFTSPEDLMRVSGIGEKKYAKLESQICI